MDSAKYVCILMYVCIETAAPEDYSKDLMMVMTMMMTIAGFGSAQLNSIRFNAIHFTMMGLWLSQ